MFISLIFHTLKYDITALFYIKNNYFFQQISLQKDGGLLFLIFDKKINY
jgi:hypothetical protein